MAIKLLRVSLALVFLWFGLLKLFDVSPVFDIIAQSYPFITNHHALYLLLGVLEIALGIGILIPKTSVISAWVMVGHLAFATLGVLLSPQAFSGAFPLLSVIGEFVVKNFVLIGGALVLISQNKNRVW